MALNLKLDGVCGLGCVSLLPSEVSRVVSASERRSPLGLRYQTCYGPPPSALPLQTKRLVIIFSHVGPDPADNL